jgi:hypothetical protein
MEYGCGLISYDKDWLISVKVTRRAQSKDRLINHDDDDASECLDSCPGSSSLL